MVDIEKGIADELQKVEESYTYLGVLKNVPLLEAMEAFNNAFMKIIDLYARVWSTEEYPACDKMFVALGEDYDLIKDLIHGNEALQPIYDGLKQVHYYLQQMRDAGMSWEEGKQKLLIINESRRE
ncbi:MAG TPA: hypothetical protein PLG17_03220 [Thermodesulfobacteriota bacterium]|nr:hypothetical protein [Thermodesulfobacteriota bacterium]